MRARFNKTGGAGKKNIRRAAAAVCEPLEARQMLDVDSHTFLTQIAYSAVEGSILETSVQITVRCSNLTYEHSLGASCSITPITADEGEDYIGTTGGVTLTGNMSGTPPPNPSTSASSGTGWWRATRCSPSH